MIQIIKGTFGYYNGRKVIPITEADGPQKFDDELEARLVKEGVAKYIGELGETAEQPAPAPGDDADEPASTNTAADEAPEYNEDMKLDELKEVATRYGVDASAMRKKADVIAAIEATKAEQPDDGADDEEPPQIGAADPVCRPSASRRWSRLTVGARFSISTSSVRSTPSKAKTSPPCWTTTP